MCTEDKTGDYICNCPLGFIGEYWLKCISENLLLFKLLGFLRVEGGLVLNSFYYFPPMLEKKHHSYALGFNYRLK